MMKKFFALLVVLLALSNVSNAQDWVEGMRDPNVNFYEVQKDFNAYWKDIEKEAEKTKKLYRQGKSSMGYGWAQYKRWEYFWQERTYPTGERPNPSVLMQASQMTGKTIGPNLGDWTAVGPFNAPNSNSWTGIGRVNCVTFHPENPDTLWIGTPAGGLWKSMDGGLTWSTNTDLLPNLGISSIAIDPQHPDTMYIATGDRDGADTYSYGILKSTDGGETWNTTGYSNFITQYRRIGALHIIPNAPQTIIAATRNGMYRSTDGGANWTAVISGQFNMLAPDPSNPNKIFAGTINSPVRIYVSHDAGATWQHQSTGLPTSGVRRVEIAVSAEDTNFVYAIYANTNNGYYGVYRSTNGGQTWTQRSSSPNLLGWDISGSGNSGQGWYDLAIAVNPTNKNQIFVGGVNVWRSNNGGTGWICVAHWYGQGGTPTVHADIHNFGWHPKSDDLFICTDGGLYKTSNEGNSYTDYKNGLNITQYYKISQSTSNPNTILGGAQDNGSHLQVSNGWNFVRGGDGMDNAINHQNDNYMYASSQNGNFSRSVNGGQNFVGMNLPPAGSGNWVTPIKIDPVNGNTAYIGYDRVWKTTNNGTSWSATSTSLGSGNIDVLDVAPSNNQIMYASINSVLYRSANGGSSWSIITNNLNVNNKITGIAINPNNADHIFITFSGYDSGKKVYETKNAGIGWKNLSGSLSNLPANCIIYEEGSQDGVYVGTDIGVYYRDGSMSDWTQFMVGLPNVIVRDFEIHYAEGKLRAATYGRGVWETPLISNFFEAPEPDFAATPVSICTTQDTVTFVDQSKNGPTSWNWNIQPNTFQFVNGTNAQSQNPEVIFNAAGNYSVSLTATNKSGTNSITKTNILTVGGLALPFTEDFESANAMERWQIENPDFNKTWEAALVSGNTPGNQAAMMSFFNYAATGQKDGLISPPLSFAGYSNVSLTFDHAYATYNASRQDTLSVYISDDCGANWTHLQTFAEDGNGSWATVASTTSLFVPATNMDWCGSTGSSSCKSVDLSSYSGQDQIRIKFESVNGFGNNLYIDNINIDGTLTSKTVASFVGDTAGCQIDSVQFFDASTFSPTSWSWSFPGGSPATSTAQNPKVFYTNSGTYDVTLYATNANGTDTVVSSNYIFIDTAVTPVVQINSQSAFVCDGDDFMMWATYTNQGNNPRFTWYRNNIFETAGNDTILLNNVVAGDEFFVVMETGEGCFTTDSVSSGKNSIQVGTLPTVSLDPFPAMCSGEGSITLSGGAPAGGTYSGVGVSNGVFDPAVAGVGSHAIYYTYMDANGCDNSALEFILVNNGPPKPTVTYNNFVLKADPISSSYTYQWIDPNGNDIPGATDTIFIPYQTGDYKVRLQFVNGCTSISDAYNVAQVGIDEESLMNNLRIFPNPVGEVLNAEVLMMSAAQVELNIIDATGKLVIAKNQKLDAGKQQIRLNVDALASGVYILQLKNEQNTAQMRFVKQ